MIYSYCRESEKEKKNFFLIGPMSTRTTWRPVVAWETAATPTMVSGGAGWGAEEEEEKWRLCDSLHLPMSWDTHPRRAHLPI